MGSQTKDRAKTTPAVMCIKILLHIFNLIYLIIGASVLGIGIWIQVQLKRYMLLTELYYDNAPWIMVGVGVLIILVALGGFCCTAKDKVALLYIYGLFITVIAILQIAAGIAGAVFSKSIDTDLVAGLKHTIQNEAQWDDWDIVQKTLHCCGVDSPQDWLNTSRNVIPHSCFTKPSTSSPTSAATIASPSQTSFSATATTATPAESTTAKPESTTAKPESTTAKPESTTGQLEGTTTQNQNEGTTTQNQNAPVRRKRQAAPNANDDLPQGCHKMITDKVQQYMSIIIGVCVGFVVLQIVGAILACVLAKKTSKNNYEQIY